MRETLSDSKGIISDFKVKGENKAFLKGVVIMMLGSGEEFKYFYTTKNIIKLYLHEPYDKEEKERAIKLPFKLTEKNAFDFLLEWIHDVDKADIPLEMSGGDGTHGLGFIAQW